MKTLPPRPDIGQLKRRARRLQRAVRAADAEAVAAVRHYDRAFDRATDEAVAEASFSVLDAQRIVARQHGFRSWPALARYVERARRAPSGSDRELAERLIARHDANVAAIERIKGRGLSRIDIFDELLAPQTRDAETLAELFERRGWPDVERIGHAAHVALARTVGNLFTQGPLNRLAIEHLDVRVGAGESPAGYLAMLVDRADLMAGHRVRYGIVGDFDAEGRISLGNDVVDPPNLDRRRATVGYPPIEEDRRQWFEMAAREGLSITRDRDAYYRDIEETATLGRWR